jgi:hypothetical protein
MFNPHPGFVTVLPSKNIFPQALWPIYPKVMLLSGSAQSHQKIELSSLTTSLIDFFLPRLFIRILFTWISLIGLSLPLHLPIFRSSAIFSIYTFVCTLLLCCRVFSWAILCTGARCFTFLGQIYYPKIFAGLFSQYEVLCPIRSHSVSV